MEKAKRKRLSKLDSISNFEEIDQRLACGWYLEMEGSGQRKRYLRSIKNESTKVA